MAAPPVRGADSVICEQPHTEPAPDLPALDNPTQEKPMLEKSTLEKPMQLNENPNPPAMLGRIE